MDEHFYGAWLLPNVCEGNPFCCNQRKVRLSIIQQTQDTKTSEALQILLNVRETTHS